MFDVSLCLGLGEVFENIESDHEQFDNEDDSDDGFERESNNSNSSGMEYYSEGELEQQHSPQVRAAGDSKVYENSSRRGGQPSYDTDRKENEKNNTTLIPAVDATQTQNAEIQQQETNHLDEEELF